METLEKRKEFADKKPTVLTRGQAVISESRLDKSGRNGIINTRGLGTKIGNNSLITEHEEPKLIKTIDISDKQAIKNTLSDFKSTAATAV